MFECATCPKVFSSEKQLKTHFYNVHQKTKEILKCEECGKQFTNKIKFDIHRIKVHTIQKCDVCGLDMAQSNLQRHKREKHEKEAHQYSCSICNKSFSRKYHLERHQSTCIIHQFFLIIYALKEVLKKIQLN